MVVRLAYQKKRAPHAEWASRNKFMPEDMYDLNRTLECQSVVTWEDCHKACTFLIGMNRDDEVMVFYNAVWELIHHGHGGYLAFFTDWEERKNNKRGRGGDNITTRQMMQERCSPELDVVKFKVSKHDLTARGFAAQVSARCKGSTRLSTSQCEEIMGFIRSSDRWGKYKHHPHDILWPVDADVGIALHTAAPLSYLQASAIQSDGVPRVHAQDESEFVTRYSDLELAENKWKNGLLRGHGTAMLNNAAGRYWWPWPNEELSRAADGTLRDPW